MQAPIEHTKSTAKQQLEAIRAPVAGDFEHLNAFIYQQLKSDVPLINEITQHIIKSGGKRLRPLLVLLAAKALGYAGDEHVELAAIIEFVHTATLLHDDVVDESKLRRGQATANALWGNQASVLIGDFLYSRAFQLLTQRAHVAVMQALADTTNAIAEGEVLQLMNCHNPDISEANYFEVITRKTAKLFASSAEIGAIIATSHPTQHRAFATYGLHAGLCFQIVDDLLDYTASSAQIGKNIGDDLTEGKTTLPLIYTLQHCDANMAKKIRQAIQTGGLDQLDTVIQAITQTQATQYCYQQAKIHANLATDALANIEPNAYTQAMHDLVQFALTRTY